MKKITLFVAAAALIGMGSAFVTAPKSGLTPNVQNTAALGQTDNWVAISDPNNPPTCDESDQRDCIANKTGSTITVLDHGEFE